MKNKIEELYETIDPDNIINFLKNSASDEGYRLIGQILIYK